MYGTKVQDDYKEAGFSEQNSTVAHKDFVAVTLYPAYDQDEQNSIVDREGITESHPYSRSYWQLRLLCERVFLRAMAPKKTDHASAHVPTPMFLLI